MRGLKIHGNESRVLSVSLNDILNQISDGELYNWSILWLKAYLQPCCGESIFDIEKNIEQSKNGLVLTWGDLLKFSDKIEQLLEILIIGDMLISNIKNYENDEEMINTCQFTIELIDSSYWIVYCKEKSTLVEMVKNLYKTDVIPIL